MAKLRKPITAAEDKTTKFIKDNYGALLSLRGVMDFLGVSRHTAEKWVADVDAININGRKRYPASDIARKIEANRIPRG